MILRAILTIQLLIICASTILAQSDEVPSVAYEWYPRYVTFLPESKLDSVLVYANTDLVPVTYEIYQTEIASNSQLEDITSTIDAILSDDRVQLAYVWVGGSASPDGSEATNRRLAGERAAALEQYLLSHSSVSADRLRVDNLGEDWYSIERAIRSSEIKDKSAVLNIITTEHDADRRERRLKRLSGGTTWRQLCSDIFPPYRNARMVIVCHAEAIKAEPAPVPEEVPIEPEPEPEPMPEPMPEPEPEPTPVEVPAPAPPVETRFIAAKTNLLWDAATIANIGVEIELGRQWSIDLPVYYSPYNLSSTRKLRVLATQPELRRWLGTKAGEGHYVGLHGHLAGFNVAINDHGRYQDPEHPLWGFGIGYGFALNFGADKHWGLEFNIGAGFANYRYDAYYNRPNGQIYKSGRDTYWGITRAGITLSYKWWFPRKPRKEAER